jgi:hypothetical protein
MEPLLMGNAVLLDLGEEVPVTRDGPILIGGPGCAGFVALAEALEDLHPGGSMTPYMLSWSVSSSAGIPCSATRFVISGRLSPSSRLNSEWTWRCVKSDSAGSLDTKTFDLRSPKRYHGNQERSRVRASKKIVTNQLSPAKTGEHVLAHYATDPRQDHNPDARHRTLHPSQFDSCGALRQTLTELAPGGMIGG